MRNSYDVKLSTLEESLRKETGGHPARAVGLSGCRGGGQPASLLTLLTDTYRALCTHQDQSDLLLTAAQRGRCHSHSHLMNDASEAQRG